MSDTPYRNISYAGPPTHGDFALWDLILDVNGVFWICTSPGSGGSANFSGGSGVSNAITSVFGRTGAVTAQTGDYTAAQVGAASTSALNAEISRATAAEAALGTSAALTAEIARAEAAEALLAPTTSLTAETARAEAAEALLAPLTGATLVSPTLTNGTVSATPSVGDNSSKVANTAFVAIALYYLQNVNAPFWTDLLINTFTSSHTITSADQGRVIEMNSSSPTTVTVNTGVLGLNNRCWVRQMGTGSVSIVGGSGMTVDAPSGLTLNGQYYRTELHWRSGSEVVLGDNLF